MSRVGGVPFVIPEKVDVAFSGDVLSVKGVGGEVKLVMPACLECRVDGRAIMLALRSQENDVSSSVWGTYGSHVRNAVLGVSCGFSVDIDIKGVGYKAEIDGEYLSLSLGYSHDIKYMIPRGVKVVCVRPVHVVVSGVDAQKVGDVVADLCKLRKYDPYKGKGLVKRGKYVLRKEANKKR